MKKTVLGALALGMTVLVSYPGQAGECPTSAENAALSMRSLQTELMVAALSCQAKGDYNTFVRQFQPELVRNGKAMRGYFQRRYGGRSESRMNSYVTSVANRASQDSLSSNNFCDSARKLFSNVLRLRSNEIQEFAIERARRVLSPDPSCTRSVDVAEAGRR